jgi:hypothetical protein
MNKSKNIEVGGWIFELNKYDVDKATTLIPELVCIFSKPFSNLLSKINDKNQDIVLDESIMKFAPDFINSVDLIFSGYLKPADVPKFLKTILEEVRAKNKDAKNATFVNLKDVYNVVFDGNVSNQFIVAKEMLIFNFQDEWQRFFGSLRGFLGTPSEAQTKSQNTSTPIKMQAR